MRLQHTLSGEDPTDSVAVIAASIGSTPDDILRHRNRREDVLVYLDIIWKVVRIALPVAIVMAYLFGWLPNLPSIQL